MWSIRQRARANQRRQIAKNTNRGQHIDFNDSLECLQYVKV